MRWSRLLIPKVMVIGSASAGSPGGRREDPSGRKVASDLARRSRWSEHDVLIQGRRDRVYERLPGPGSPGVVVHAMGASGDGDIPQDRDAIVRWVEKYCHRKDEEFKYGADSPLPDAVKGQFKKLSYFPVNLTYRFEGPIDRHETK